MRKGFTLLELLIVVIIIGILATIAVPQFLNAAERARVAKARSNLALIIRALKMHRAEHDTYINVRDNEANHTLGRYIELRQVDEDRDWEYEVTGADATTFTATAEKMEGTANAGARITIDQNGACHSDHPLSGLDCPLFGN